jgi:uncharacterized protein involved in response to NO
MLFGYLAAVIAGFLLTAIPNWTGRFPIAGGRLAALAGLWLAARLAVLFSATVGAIPAFALDVGFLIVLAAVCGREVLAAKNRNVPVVAAVLIFALANAADHAEALGMPISPGLGWRGGFAVVLTLISLIGGRIIPSFTRNWLTKQSVKSKLPSQPDQYDIATIGATVVALICWTIAPNWQVSGGFLAAAGILQAIRLGRWSGLKTFRDPLVFILHVAYAWLPLGLLLLGLGFISSSVPRSVAVHALSAGAMASMTVAVMTRATLGHTGRELKADRRTVAIYAGVTLGALVRVAAPLLPLDYMRSIEVAGMLWGGAFLLFVIAYGPKLLSPRVGRAP